MRTAPALPKAVRGDGSGGRRRGRVGAGLIALLPALAAGCDMSDAPPELASYRAPPSVAPASEPRPVPLPPLSREVALVGMATGEVAALFGQPSLKRAERAAQYWRYSFPDCSLDLYAYHDPATGEDRVVHFELRATGRQLVAEGGRSCATLARHLVPPTAAEDNEATLPPVENH